MSDQNCHRDSLARFSARVLEQVNEAVAIITPDIRIAWVNAEFCRLTGYELEEVLGQPLTMMRPDTHSDAVYEQIKRAVLDEGRWHGEIRRRKKNGETFPAWLTISAVYDEQGAIECFVDLFVDIERVRKERERLEFLVNHDALTDLPTRRLFWDRLENAIRRAERHERTLALVFMDLDGFKLVNDSLGHRYGDQLLVRVANALRSCVRSVDTVARVGGDEFVVLLEEYEQESDVDEAVDRIERVLDPLWRSLPDGIEAGASIGVARYPMAGKDADTLYSSADKAMYDIKKQRSNGR